METRHTRWIGLAASTAALLYGGPAAATLAGFLGSKHLVEFLTDCFGQNTADGLSAIPDALKAGVPNIAANFFCEKLQAIQRSGAQDGLNHDLRRGMVIAIARVLQRQHRSLNHMEGRDEFAISSGFRAEVFARFNDLEPAFNGLYQAWNERLQGALADPHRLDALFPSAKEGNLPTDEARLDAALAETAAYTTADAGTAPVWGDLFDKVLAPEQDKQLSLPVEHRRFRLWDTLTLRRAKEPEDQRVRRHLATLTAAGLDLRSEVTRSLQARFPAAFAEVVKSDEHKKTWIAYLKFLTETTRDGVIRVEQELHGLRKEQTAAFERLEARLTQTVSDEGALTRLSDGAANVLGALGQSEERITQVIRNESAAVRDRLDELLRLQQKTHTVVVGTHEELKRARRDILEAGKKVTSLRERWGLVATAIIALAALVILLSLRQTSAIRNLEQQMATATQHDAADTKLLGRYRQRYEAAAFSTKESDPGARAASVLADLAREYGLTVDELRQRILQAAEGARERLILVRQLRAASEREAARHKEMERAVLQELASAASAASQHAEALKLLVQALELTDRAIDAATWASLQFSIGNVHLELGICVEGPAARVHLSASVAGYREVLKMYTREQLPQDWAMTQNNLGNALCEQGGRSEGLEAAHLLSEAVSAFREALKVYTREQLPQDWAMTQNNLGAALRAQAGLSAGPELARLLSEAVSAFREALKVYTREQLPQGWAMTQNNLGAALRVQAGLSEGPEVARLLNEAVSAFREALKVYTSEQLRQDWAMTQNNLGNAFFDQAGRSEGPEVVRLLSEAVSAFRKALRVYTREQLPQDWAMTQNNLGAALRVQAGRSEGPEAAARLLSEAVSAFREALKVYTREQLPQGWATTQNNLGAAFFDQAGRSEGPEAVRLLGEAVSAYRDALKVYTREQFPQGWAMTQNNLQQVETQLAKLRGNNP